MTTDRDDELLEQNLTTLLAGSEPTAPDQVARARMRARLIARHGRTASRWSPTAIAGWGLITAAAGALVVANVTGGDGPPAGTRPTAVAPPPVDDDLIKLADGTTARLGAGGKLIERGPRRVTIEGEVLLDVAPGKGTFTVETSQGELAVLGTRFLVEALADRTTTSVLRGAVALRSGGHEEVVHAGEQGVMHKGVRPTRGPAPRLSHLVSWVAERRRRDERPASGPMRSGALVARNPQAQTQEFPLPMAALTIDVHLENQQARVALDQTFHNPQDQTLEGVYKFALPPGAAVSRLAMYVDGKLMESAVVERMAARRIYEDIVYQRRDPALLEQMGASKVSMRIFPLVPHQDKRVVLAYTQPLARTYDDVTLTVPLPDLDQPVGALAMQVKVVGCASCEISSPSHPVEVRPTGADAVVSYRASRETLGDSLVLRVRQPAPPVTVATTIADAQRYLLVRARPTLPTAAVAAPEARPKKWILLDDTSASRGPVELRAQAALIDRLVDDIDEHDQVMVIAFDATHRRFSTWQDAMAIDRRALGEFLATDAGLGETDLGQALAGAVTLLDGAPGYVVYVGDGTATGERRTIDELRDAIAGKATFIGIGVGDGSDLSTLGALADATGGVATTIDLGDDLAWRSLDLVASLYTPRVTGLTATLDGPGADASALLRSRQVAAGEDIELVVRAPARDDVHAVTLRGQLDGQPWQQTIPIAGAAKAPGDGGYLPRLWAQRRLEALMTAGDRAFAPCTTTPCPSDEERAIAAYHARKAEMVALGTAHFLLSQHTSLIVLENDAMYGQYGVRKGAGDGWATYALPATIPTTAVTAPPIADATTDVPTLWRGPLAWRYQPDGEVEGSVGLGRMGTLGHGAGSGTGYGFGGTGFGRGGGGKAVQTVATEAKKEDSADSQRGLAGVLDDNKDSDRARMTMSDAVATKGAPMDLGGAVGQGDSAAQPSAGSGAGAGADSPPPPPAAPAASAPAPVTAPIGRSAGPTTAVAAEPRRDVDADTAVGTSRSSAPRWRSPDVVANRRAWSDDGFERQQFGGGVVTRLMPIALQYTGDWRLADLTTWLPGLARTAYDDAADALDAGGDQVGSITPDAAELLTTARATLGAGRWRIGADAEVAIDDRGRFEQRRTLDSGVEEVVTYDGHTLAYRYPQFGVGADRVVGDREPALFAQRLPLVPARPSYLARFFRITRAGQTLTLVPVAGGPTQTMTIGTDGTIAELRVGPRAVSRAVSDGAGWALTTAAGTTRVTFQPDRNLRVVDAAVLPVNLALPLAPLSIARQEVEAEALRSGTTSSQWRVDQHRRAASALAVGDVSELATVAAELAGSGTLSPGELTLVSGAAAYVTPATVERAIGGQVSPIADFLRASRGADRRALAAAAASPGPVGTIATYRQVLVARETGSRRTATEAFRRFIARNQNDVLRVIAAQQLVASYAWDDPTLVTALDDVATGSYRNLVRAEAASFAAYGRRGGGAGASAERWIALMTDVDLTALPPAIDGSAYSMIVNSPRGQLGWTQAMAGWRQRALTSDRLDHVMAFTQAAAIAPSDDLDAGIDRALALGGDDPALVRTLYLLAQRGGRLTKAQAILDGALAKQPDAPDLLRLASAGAANQGDPERAAAYLDRAMTLEADRPVALTRLQADYGQLIAWHGQQARGATGAARDAALAKVLDASRDWRAMDPDNAERERQVAAELLAVGRDDEAWRYLSSPIDRAPREGASFVGAATVLESAGKLEQALGLWRRAFAVDATNPTWLQRQAMTELALGRRDAARATIQKIVDRRWHVQWDGVQYWAQDARRGL